MNVFVNKVGIISNEEKDVNLQFTNELAAFIESLGKQVVVRKIGDENCTGCDFFIALGGDGTMLRAAKVASQGQTPILGINLGTLGYLTDVEKTGAQAAVQRVFDGEFKFEKRIMLDAIVETKTETINFSPALNECVISRGHLSKMVGLEIYINDEYIDFYRADGLIVATPTGSTAYNLSAGGPVLPPDSHMIALTPVCSHNMFSRPLVLSASDVVRIKPVCGHAADNHLNLDGDVTHALTNDAVVTIRKSNLYATIIKTTNKGFYEVFRAKMSAER